MKKPVIGLWVYRNDGGATIQEKIKSKLEARGIKVINDFDMRDCYCKNGQVYTQNGFDLSTLDLLYHMNADERTNHQIAILKAIELSGVKVINAVKPHELAGDKFFTNLILRKNGILVPNAVLIDKNMPEENLRNLIKDWKSIIIKPRNGHGARGIIKIDSIGQLLDYIANIKDYVDNFYLEQFIDFGNHDYRVELLDGEVIGCYSRQCGDSFKTNVHAGGRQVYTGNYDEPINIAKKVANIIDITTTIIDIIKCKNTGRFYVLEANNIMGIFTEACVKEAPYCVVKEIPLETRYDDRKIDMLVHYLIDCVKDKKG